jgi:hypothetical protein
MGVFADYMARLLAEDRRRLIEQTFLVDAMLAGELRPDGPIYDAQFRVVEDPDCPPDEVRFVGPGPDGAPAILGKIINIGDGEA